MLLPIILLVVLRLFYAPILAACASLLIEDDGPRRSDVIVVLGGDGYGDRIAKGGDLVKQGYAPYAIVSGPPMLVGYESTTQLLYATTHGYPAALFREAQLPRQDAESTATEAAYLGKMLRSQGVKSVLLVTSNYHSRRAAKLWRRENPGLTITVVPSADPVGFFTPSTWYKTRGGQKMFLLEWLKTFAAFLRL